MTYLLTLVTFFCVGIILSMSLNLLIGYVGEISIAHGGFTGIGAYGAAWIAINLHLNMIWAILFGAIVSGFVAWLFALATSKIRSEEFILASFALQMVIIEAIGRWTSVTRGTYGLAGVPKPSLFGTRFSDVEDFAVFAVIVTFLCGFVLMRLGGMTYGIVLRGVRESIPSMQALGRDTTRIKIVVLVLSAAFAGIAGGLQASFVTFIHPDGFAVMLSIIIMAYILVGGIGNMWGAALGAVLLLALPELISNADFIPSNMVGPMERVVYGLILVLFVWFRPKGLIVERPILHVDRFIRRGIVRRPATSSTSAEVSA